MNFYTVEVSTNHGTKLASKLSKSFFGMLTMPILGTFNISRALNINKSLENSTANITFKNVQQEMNVKFLMTNIHLRGKAFKVYDNAYPIISGAVADLPRGNILEILMKGDFFTMINEAILPEITQDDYSDCPPENVGKVANVLMGTADDSNINNEGMLEAHRINNSKRYLATYHYLSQLLLVRNEAGTDVTSDCVIVNDTDDGRAYIKYQITDPPDLTLRFNAKGPEENSVLIENPAAMLGYVLSQVGGFTVNVSEAEGIFNSRGGYSGNCLIVNQKDYTYQNLLEDFQGSYGCWVFLNKLGQFIVKVIQKNETPAVKIHQSCLKNFIFYRNIKSIYGIWETHYRYHFTNKEYNQNATISAWNNYPHIKKTKNRKFIRNWADNKDITDREAALHKDMMYEYSFEVPRVIARDIELGDTVQIQHWKNIFPDYRDVFITRENRSDKGFVKYEGIDLTNIEGTI